MKRMALSVILMLITFPSSAVEDNIFSSLEDIWGESFEDCQENPHRIAFEMTDGGMIMRLDYEVVGAATAGDVRESFVYDVKGFNDIALLVELRGENRMDMYGEPVEWRIIRFEEDRYCWHREDWDPEQCTVARVRCSSVSSEGEESDDD